MEDIAEILVEMYSTMQRDKQKGYIDVKDPFKCILILCLIKSRELFFG